MTNLTNLWQIHQDAKWPEALDNAEGELMMLDTVIVGCITYYVEEKELDPQRVEILQDSLSELDQLLPDLPDEGMEYFSRLRQLGTFILKESSDAHTS
ncbi:MAG: hypothetical protein NPIRA01_39540 [Nitrospirales bacterium]|nr:MAG: hypothetical protein NPIRA01_39540 [Nitrospirales bacterium]